MEDHPIIVLITTPTQDSVRLIANALLEKRLAACVNILSGIKSLFFWEGKMNEDEEVLLLAKTHADLFVKLVPVVKALHPYQVPEIIALPIRLGDKAYLDWIGEVTA